MGIIDHHDALIYTMVMVSAVDQDMSDEELYAIGNIIKYLPIFNDYGRNRLTGTAYALACDVAAADSHVSQEELRLLETIRHHQDIDRLSAAAIERSARADYILPQTAI